MTERRPRTEEVPARPPRRLRVVVVHTKTEQAIRGILRERDSLGNMVLSSPSLMTTDRNGVPVWQAMDGEVVVPGANVDFYQTALDASFLTPEV